MIKYNELKVGDLVMTEFDGRMLEGEVTNLNGDEKQVCVETEVQEFWYEPEHLFPIPMTDEQLLRMNFTKEVGAEGGVKYKKGAFRIKIPAENNFNEVEIWYREEHRIFHHNLMIHELQNHYLQMTKVHLTKDVMV